MCDQAVAHSPRLLRHVSDPFRTPGMRIKAVEKDPPMLRHVPDHFKTKDMCDKAVEKLPRDCNTSLITLRPNRCVKKLLKKCHECWKLSSISPVIDQYKTQEMCIKTADESLRSLACVPDHFKTQEMCIKAVEAEPWYLCHVPDLFKTQKYVIRQ